jgi:hypothetical protein
LFDITAKLQASEAFSEAVGSKVRMIRAVLVTKSNPLQLSVAAIEHKSTNTVGGTTPAKSTAPPISSAATTSPGVSGKAPQ